MQIKNYLINFLVSSSCLGLIIGGYFLYNYNYTKLTPLNEVVKKEKAKNVGLIRDINNVDSVTSMKSLDINSFFDIVDTIEFKKTINISNIDISNVIKVTYESDSLYFCQTKIWTTSDLNFNTPAINIEIEDADYKNLVSVFII